MKINTHNAEILLSAANKSHYPQDQIPEVALAGRSNVGKSSFINTMLNRKNLARTSGKPGKTQLLNFFNIDDKLRFVDVPGYGYAKVQSRAPVPRRARRARPHRPRARGHYRDPPPPL